MTLQQFLEKLSMTSGWRLNRHGQLRRPFPGLRRLTWKQQCPITAVAGTPGIYVAPAWAREMGLDEEVARGVVSAADNALFHDPHNHVRAVRDALLRACRLI
jgi:hypothetical protein